jgi:hypothetical protein
VPRGLMTSLMGAVQKNLRGVAASAQAATVS